MSPRIGRQPGRYGGECRTLIGSQKDIRADASTAMRGWSATTRSCSFTPDILESYESRTTDLHLQAARRPQMVGRQPAHDGGFPLLLGRRVLNEDLPSGGLPRALLVDGKPPHFEIVDPLTVRYTWDAPNPDFLPSSLPRSRSAWSCLPAYLKQFHENYQDKDKLKALMKKNKAKKWAALAPQDGAPVSAREPGTADARPLAQHDQPPAEQFVFERNPYFHRVDENGPQLPYIDRFILNISSSAIIPAKTGAGESDLQAMGIDFADYTFLKEAEKRYPVKVSAVEAHARLAAGALAQPQHRRSGVAPLLRDVRFRRALSLAINRDEINKAVFFGLGKESANTVLPESPLFKPEFAQAWIAATIRSRPTRCSTRSG